MLYVYVYTLVWDERQRHTVIILTCVTRFIKDQTGLVKVRMCASIGKRRTALKLATRSKEKYDEMKKVKLKLELGISINYRFNRNHTLSKYTIRTRIHAVIPPNPPVP